jgi:hypothetical protein
MQAVLRSFLALRMEHHLFDELEKKFGEHGLESSENDPHSEGKWVSRSNRRSLPKSEHVYHRY